MKCRNVKAECFMAKNTCVPNGVYVNAKPKQRRNCYHRKSKRSFLNKKKDYDSTIQYDRISKNFTQYVRHLWLTDENCR